MKDRSPLNGRWASLALVAAIASMAFLIPASTAAERQAIPFVGMSMAYYGVDWDGNAEIRTICVFRHDEANNHVIVRDSLDTFDVEVVDLATREVESHTGWGTFDPFYVEYWIPTDVKVGSHVGILNYDAVVVGSSKMCVDGRVIDVWQLQASGQNDDGSLWQDTWYYDKKTGLWVSAAWIVWDAEGTVINTWGGHLESTNAVLG